MNYQATCALISYIFKSAFRTEPRPAVSDVVSRPQLYNSSQIDCLIGSLVHVVTNSAYNLKGTPGAD